MLRCAPFACGSFACGFTLDLLSPNIDGMTIAKTNTTQAITTKMVNSLSSTRNMRNMLDIEWSPLTTLLSGAPTLTHEK
jgi:hypothetical protein